jgi:hypothetical protein
MIGKYPKKGVLEFICFALVFALVSGCTTLKTIEFNIKLVLMILLFLKPTTWSLDLKI